MNFKIFKWLFKFFATIALIGILCIVFFNYNPNRFYELREFFNKNSISIYANNNLNKHKVDIYWYSDFKSGQVIKNGKITDLAYKEYGPNKFIVLYEKDTIKEFIHYKSNNWHGHQYLISLSKGNNKNINAEIEIIGPDIN